MDVMIEITFNSKSPPNILTETAFKEQVQERLLRASIT
jgi:hypothetical protein